MKLQIFTETASQTFVPSKIHKNSYRAPNDLKQQKMKVDFHIFLTVTNSLKTETVWTLKDSFESDY